MRLCSSNPEHSSLLVGCIPSGTLGWHVQRGWCLPRVLSLLCVVRARVLPLSVRPLQRLYVVGWMAAALCGVSGCAYILTCSTQHRTFVGCVRSRVACVRIFCAACNTETRTPESVLCNTHRVSRLSHAAARAHSPEASLRTLVLRAARLVARQRKRRFPG